MKLLITLFSIPLVCAALAAMQAPDWMTTKARAEELYASGSFELAHRAYAAIDPQSLGAPDRRWLAFRLADTRWRAAAGAQNADDTDLQEARKGLVELQQGIERLEQRDRTWALAEESLGDWSWQRRGSRDLGSALPHYQNALAWWAATRDVEAARARYLDIVFRLGWPDGGKAASGWWTSQIPLELAQNAVQIAQAPADRAQSRFLLAVVLQNRGDFDSISRTFEILREIVGEGRGVRFRDDALYRLAQMLEQRGEPVVAEDGSWTSQPDFVAALKLYQELQSEYAEGESAFWDDARDRIRSILRIEVGLGVGGAYLPGSEIGYSLSWRNAAQVELSLHAVDLTRHVDLAKGDRSWGQWLESIDTSLLEPVRKFTFATKDDGRHVPGSAELRLEDGLAPGAYVLEARSGDARARELVLVSRTSIVMKAVGDRVLVWTCDALTSEPVRGAKVKLWVRTYERGSWRWRVHEATAGADGTAAFDVAGSSSHELFAAALQGERTAFAAGGSNDNTSGRLGWRIFAVTDRSTYKPNDAVNWKIVARRSDGGAWLTPNGATLDWEVFDPRGTSWKKGSVKLSDFGSAFGAFTPDGQAPLGEYRVNFAHQGSNVASATLFRLEEYKLPEFEVRVKPADDDGRPRLYVVGDKVGVDVEASFYAGGPVAEAQVVFVVTQRPFWRTWTRARDFPWFYADEQDQRFSRHWGGTVVKQETAKTDARGRARIEFETPRDPNQDFEYTIEARVTDASRREIAGTGLVRVTRREYDVHATLPHNLQRPHAKAEVSFEAQDANGHGVAAEGTVTVTRERWVEIWVAPDGREVSGAELRALHESLAPFPPPVGPKERPWRWKSAGYVGEEVAKSNLKLGADGRGTFVFTPEKTGTYRVRWTSRDGRKRPVETEAWTWCVSEDVRELGFSSNGLEIVVDQDTFQAGERAPVLLTTSISNRWVLLTIEGQKLHSFQVVKVDGTAKLVMLDVSEAHVPNVVIAAATTLEGRALSDAKEVVVPPLEQFLDVTVTADRDPVRPGTKGAYEIVALDRSGAPVRVELTLGVVDEAVAAIQGDYAGDIRKFFYGDKKPWLVQTHTSFDQRAYRKYVLDENGRVVDAVAWSAGRRDAGKDLSYAFGVGGASKASGGRYRGVSDSVAAPTAAMAGADAFAEREVLALGKVLSQELKNEAGELGEIEVRSDFRETALWSPTLVTGADGRARVEVEYPDSLTRWKAHVRAIDAGTKVGTSSVTVRAQKPLVARLQAPRFFTVGDETLVSGVIGNRTDAPVSVQVDLVVEGVLEAAGLEPRTLTIAPGGEKRVDWRTRALRAGDVKLTLRALGAGDSDAMTRTYPVQDHGLEVQVARSLKLSDRELVATLEIPAARTRETTSFTVDVAPSLAVTMLDALPYLVRYPYGCTEQTMSRFLPAAIVAHTLRTRGLSVEDGLARAFGGIEPETAGTTHKDEKRALDELDRVTRESLQRLVDFQHSDGGWGWWKDGESDRWMSAYVVWGLALARDAGLDVKLDVLDRGVAFLTRQLVEAEVDPDLAAWMLHALGASGKARGDEHVERAFAMLREQKHGLRAYGKALFALAAQAFGKTDEARILCQNLANGVTIDAHPDQSRIGAHAGVGHADALATARWGSSEGWWRWQDGAIESTAFALRALCTIDPANPLASQAANWLVQNRRGAQWNNTRDSAIAILALDTFLDATGEVARDVEYELVVNGTSVAKKRVTAAEMLRAPARFTIPPGAVRDGANEIRLRRVSGEGPLYLAARAVFFSREDPIRARGSDVFVTRQYFKLVPRSTLLAGLLYDRLPLEDGGTVRSGERVEVVLTIETKNDFEYLMFEDAKPAGLEAVSLTSGEHSVAREIKKGEVARRFANGAAPADAPDDSDWARFTGRQRGLHQELRDRHVALFVDRLGQGVWEVRYELRAEVPGHFSALPTCGYAMYVPEVRCNGDEIKLTVSDRAD